ncbi:MAG: glycosyltransferase family 2 protein [Parachlamydiaceae bacterium]
MREEYIYWAYWLDPFFLIYFASINFVYLYLLFLGCIKIYKRSLDIPRDDYTRILRSDSLPTIGFLVAAYNEQNDIESAVDNLLHLSYRYKQIIVINDGSTDDTLKILIEKYQLLPVPYSLQGSLPSMPIKTVYRSRLFEEIMVIDKANGKKFDALNAGLNLCTTPYYITVDADTYIENDSFERLIRPILINPETIAIGASVRIRNGCTLNFTTISTNLFPLGYVTAMQSIEYLRAFLMRMGWDYTGGNYVLSGAFAVFETDIIRKVGGYAPTVADDLEIILRLNHAFKATKTPYKITYLPDPTAWTEGPWTLKELARQRFLWQRGTLESMWFHKKIFFNPRYGAFGMFVYPFLFFGEALEPIIEITGCIYIVVGLCLNVINGFELFLLLSTIWGFNFIYTLFCILIEELTFRKYPSQRSFCLLVWYSFLENFGYRQLNLIWRIRGIRGFFQRFSEIQKDSKRINEIMENIIKKGKIR